MSSKRIYFPNLNGLRFLAAILVLVAHVEQFKSLMKMENYWDGDLSIRPLSHIGVLLFFVLSGFLITFLILSEERKTGSIDIRKFYIRRALRIWPLYFFVVLISLFVIPFITFFTIPGFSRDSVQSTIWLKLILFTLFMPNLVLTLLGFIPYAAQTWSIGTEEQFYLFWPVLFKLFRVNRLVLILAVLVTHWIIGEFIAGIHADSLPYGSVLKSFWLTFQIDYMAFGAVFAYLLFSESKSLKYLVGNFPFFSATALVIYLTLTGIKTPVFNQIQALLFGLIILNLVSNKSISSLLENRVLNYLGIISYGIYLLHPIGIIVAMKISLGLNLNSNWFIYPLSLIFTILISGASYKYFESFFLKFKEGFSVVASGSQKCA
jgi:peptidoglycan/LPS O-acetylase OafA/YrhL